MHVLSLEISERPVFSNEEDLGHPLTAHRDHFQSAQHRGVNNTFVCGFLILTMVLVALNMMSGPSEQIVDDDWALLAAGNGDQTVYPKTIPWHPHP